MSLLAFFGLDSLSPKPTDDFWYGPVGQQTAAGIAVDESVAMTYSACWAATMLLSTAVGGLPLKLHRKLPGGGAEPATDDPRYDVVASEPNPDMSSMMFRASRLEQQINSGNCFAEIERDNSQNVVALWPINSKRIPQRNVVRDGDGRIVYLVNNDNGTKTTIPAEDMLHVPSPMSDDGIYGRGVVESARLSIGFGLATETQGAAYFGNSARPTLVIEGVKFANVEERKEFRREWAEAHGGPAKNGMPGILPKDAKLTALSFNAQDSQFIETRQHNVEEVARWYGVPQHLIGHLLRSTNNNIEQQSLEFSKFSCMRWSLLWEQELGRKLLNREERKTLFFRHNFDALERADIMNRTTALKDQLFNGALTINQWMALEDRNPIGPVGDIHWVQQAMIPVELAAKGPQPPQNSPKTAEKGPENDQKPMPDEPKNGMSAASLELLSSLNDRLGASQTAEKQQLSEATNAVLEQIIKVMLDREAKDALEAARKPSQFLKWLDEFYADHETRMEKALSHPIRACALAAGIVALPSVLVRECVKRHATAGRELLLAAASGPPEQFTKSVETCVTTWNRREILNYLGGCNGNGRA